MEQFPRIRLVRWATAHPEVLALFVFGSRATGKAGRGSDLDLAFDLDETRETAFTVLVNNAGNWKAELSQATGLLVKDLYLRSDAPVNGIVIEVFRRTPQ